MAKAFIDDTHLTDIADAIRATLDESRQYLPSEMAAAIDSIPVMAQLNRKKYFQSVSAGAASGYATIEQIEGNTVVWNQLVENGDFSDGTTGWSFDGTASAIDNDLTLSINASMGTFIGATTSMTNTIVGHVYLLSSYVKTNDNSSGNLFMITVNSLSGLYVRNNGVNNSYVRVSGIATASVSRTTLTVGQISARTGVTLHIQKVQLIDLTAIFGAGNEPTTVADFEAWRDQNGIPAYADYSAGELLSCKMSGMQTKDSSQQTLDTIALDVTTITGINTATNVREVIFPNGMKQADRAGTVKDILDLQSDTATVNVGSRAYQSGDESDTSVITDGTTTYYALITPITYTDLQDANGNPLNPRYKVEQGGTEQVLPVNTSTPTTVAPTLTTTYTKDVH